MNLTRKQELLLIDLGLRWLLEHLPSNVVSSDGEILPKEKKVSKPKRKKRKWSPEQHKKFARTMKKIWKERKEENQPKQ